MRDDAAKKQTGFHMVNTFLRMLPGAENLSARLTLLTGVSVAIGLVLALLGVIELVGRTPVDMGAGFKWVVFCAGCLLLLWSLVLWLTLKTSVLRPLEQIQEVHEKVKPGFGAVVDTMLELRDAVERAQAELDESHKNLRHVEKLAMVGKLAAGVAHSIRNPLTSVKLRLFSLERSLLLELRQEEDFRVIAEAIRHIDIVLTNFLEFSRRPQLSMAIISPNDVVDASLKLLENRLSSFPVSVMRERNILPPVYADPDQLREALLNILLNACDAMEYNGNLRVCEWVEEHGGKQFVFISVHDSGSGIHENQIGQVFVPFFSTKEQGTGLGLPIAKGILEEHGGDILVSSSLLDGTTFTLVLPAS